MRWLPWTLLAAVACGGAEPGYGSAESSSEPGTVPSTGPVVPTEDSGSSSGSSSGSNPADAAQFYDAYVPLFCEVYVTCNATVLTGTPAGAQADCEEGLWSSIELDACGRFHPDTAATCLAELEASLVSCAGAPSCGSVCT